MKYVGHQALVAGLLISLVSAAVAQTPSTAESGPGGASSLEEVIVTAQKRAENVQTIPVAVTVVSGAQLERAGVRDFSDMTKVSPSLTIRAADQPVNASVAIRGIGTFAYGIGVEPSVAVQVDDVPVAFQPRAFADLTDIGRVEVLRGPQSTLYGKSASAGLINITTLGPSDTFTAMVNLLGTSDDEYRGALTLSGPLSSTLGYRLTASGSDFKGNVGNIATGDKVNGSENKSVRAKLVWKQQEHLAATVGANYNEGKSDSAPPFIRLSPNARLRGNPALTPDVVMPGISAGTDNLALSQNTPPYAKNYGFGQWLKVQYELPADYSLVSISSHDQYRLDDQLDVDRTGYPNLVNFQGGRFKARVLTQEFRLLSPSKGPFVYTAGLFYGDNDLSRRFSRGPLFSIANWYATSESKSYAAFGQSDWTFLPATTATIGLRAQKEDISYTFDDFTNAGAFSGSSSDNVVTYRFGLRHEFTDDLMVFTSFAKGHKGQTYDLTTGFNAARAAAGPVRPENSRSYELGVRSQFFDRRLTLNATVFDTDYDGFQAQGIEQVGGVQNYRLTNVGKTNTRGVEIDANARASQHLRLTGGFAYIDAKIKEYPAANCYPGQTVANGCVGTPGRQNLAGATLPNSPKVKLNAGWDYWHPLSPLPFDGVFSGSYTWQSEVNFSLSQDPETVQGNYGILNLAAGIRHPDDAYQVMVLVNNVLDKGYAVAMGNQFGNFGNALATDFTPARDFKRYVGVQLSMKF